MGIFESYKSYFECCNARMQSFEQGLVANYLMVHLIDSSTHFGPGTIFRIESLDTERPKLILDNGVIYEGSYENITGTVIILRKGPWLRLPRTISQNFGDFLTTTFPVNPFTEE